MAKDPLAVRPGLTLAEGELSWRFSRSSGPGGQSVNTTDSRVELSFDVTRAASLSSAHRARALTRLNARLVDGVLTVSAQEHRSQFANREAALRRLVRTLHEATAADPRERRATRPSRSAVERRIAGKKHRAEIKKGRRSLED